MGVRINSNAASLAAQRRLAENSSLLSRAMERLSTGARISRASDDAAGLAISSILDARVRVFGQAVRNLNDGISLANIAEGALSSLRDITIRQQELSAQSANGTYSLEQRRAMSAEARKLTDEYNRIADSAAFNGSPIFAEDRAVRIQAGIGTEGSLVMNAGSALAKNVGDGTFFDPVTTIASTVEPSSPLLGDFNGDGNLDVVMTSTIMLGKGDGTFEAEQALETNGLAFGDFNQDGKLDLVGTDFSSTYMLTGNGDGTFQAAISIGAGAESLSIADFNEDGRTDVVIKDWSSVRVLINNGGLGFGEKELFNLAGDGFFSSFSDVATGDFNGDGFEDVIAVNNQRHTFNVSFGNGAGSFSARTVQTLTSTFPEYLEVADFDADGRSDLLITGAVQDGEYGFEVFKSLGTGQFQIAFSVTCSMPSNYEAAGDLNGDGLPDVISSGAGVFLNEGHGTFQRSSNPWTLDYETGLAIGDLNNDNRPDYVKTYSYDDSSTHDHFLFASLAKGGTTAHSAYLNLSRRDGALDAMTVLDENLRRIEAQLGELGAITSRLAVAAATVRASQENEAAASSRITDSDIAQESATMIRARILRQTGTAVLAQANQQPALALQLLASR